MKHVIDPLYERIEIPQWLNQAQKRLGISRMHHIRQLGLKSYSLFPSATHTRYSHCLGTMHLVEKLRTKLLKRAERNNRGELHETLQSHQSALTASAFFHDAGHGPFSHTLDYPIRKQLGIDHTDLALDIIKSCDDVLDRNNISVNQVCKIISNSEDNNFANPYPFLKRMIDGPVDVDKMDYLLRDSYFTGYQYGFDLDELMNQIRVLGDGSDLGQYQIGLSASPEAITIAEQFFLTRKTMYDMVYHRRPPRIAEKMLEKAVLFAIDDNEEIRCTFSKNQPLLELKEAELLDMLGNLGNYPSYIVDSILQNEFYTQILDLKLDEKFHPDSSFMLDVKDDAAQTSDKLSRELSSECQPYGFICDIIERRQPKNIRIDYEGIEKEPILLKDKSRLVNEMLRGGDRTLYVYARPNLVDDGKANKDEIEDKVNAIVWEWNR